MLTRRKLITGAAALVALLLGVLAPAEGQTAWKLLLLGNTRLSLPGLFNYTNASLPHWKSQRAKVVAGTANALVLMIGDSTTYGAGSNNVLCGLRAQSYPNQTAALLSSIKASASSIGGGGNAISNSCASYAAYNPAVTLGTGWGELGGVPTVGATFLQSSSNASSLTLTPSRSTDTLDVWYGQAPAHTGLNVAVNGGSTMATINTAGTVGNYAHQTISTTLGNNVWDLTTNGTGAAPVNVVRAYNSTAKEVSIINVGWSGATSNNWAVADGNNYGWEPPNSLSGYGADLVIIMLGINDARTGISTATYQANIQTLINLAKAGGGDVLLMSQLPIQTGVSCLGGNVLTQGQQQAYVNTLYTLATANNVPLLDIFLRMGSWANEVANGWNFDCAHLLSAGYTQIATPLAAVLSN